MTASARDGMPDDAVNLHGSGIVLGDRGVLILGPSGTGKSQLALALVNRWHLAGRHARFVADDQLFAVARHGRLLMLAPHAIAGLAEAWFYGPAGVRHEPAAVVDLVVEIGQPDPPRFQQGVTTRIAGVELACIALPDQAGQTAIMAVAGALSAPPFV